MLQKCWYPCLPPAPLLPNPHGAGQISLGKKNCHLRPVELLQWKKGNPGDLSVPGFCSAPWGLILAACTPIKDLHHQHGLRCPSDHRVLFSHRKAVQAGDNPEQKGFANNSRSANTTWLSSAALSQEPKSFRLINTSCPQALCLRLCF